MVQFRPIGSWMSTIETIQSEEMEARKGLHWSGCGFFKAVYVAPPGVPLEDIQLPFSPEAKYQNNAVCQQQVSHSPPCLSHHIFWGFSHWQRWSWIELTKGWVLFLSILFHFLINSVSRLFSVGLSCSVIYPFFSVSPLNHACLPFLVILSPPFLSSLVTCLLLLG